MFSLVSDKSAWARGLSSASSSAGIKSRGPFTAESSQTDSCNGRVEHHGGAAGQQDARATAHGESVQDVVAVAADAFSFDVERCIDGVDARDMGFNAAHAGKKAGARARLRSIAQGAMHGHRLSGVFDAANGSQLTVRTRQRCRADTSRRCAECVPRSSCGRAAEPAARLTSWRAEGDVDLHAGLGQILEHHAACAPCGQRFQQWQRAGCGVAVPQGFQAGMCQRRRRRVGQRDVNARERARAGFGREYQRHRKRIGHGPHRIQRLRIIAVIGDQQRGRGINCNLAEAVQQAGGKAAVIRAQHVGRRHRVRGDAPVAGRRVVHGVVEARRRQFAIVASQRLADGVAVVAVAARRAEDRGQRGGIASARCNGFVADCQREFDHRPRSTTFDRRQAGWRRQFGRRVCVGCAACEHVSRVRPILQAGAQHADAFDEDAQAGHDDTPTSPARAKTRLQFVPPKPNALLSAARTGASRLVVR
ncbi:hypothetical protein COLO4_01772 [Corchorus olitorius]|uniref:Uncharacterized protein n=1 Tax=Corchorus olitorius TaxID=93759 RepID=A0A1R3L290_9ROSI|nr:hypothetical protein COLO4_01772 [Corchorus olitorius]